MEYLRTKTCIGIPDVCECVHVVLANESRFKSSVYVQWFYEWILAWFCIWIIFFTSSSHLSNFWSQLLVCTWYSYGIAAISPFSHRLTFDNLPMDIQRLRCKVNFQALVFVPHIRALGDALVSRLRYPSRRTEVLSTNYLRETTDVIDENKASKFVVIHLRFDKVPVSCIVKIYVYFVWCMSFWNVIDLSHLGFAV